MRSQYLIFDIGNVVIELENPYRPNFEILTEPAERPALMKLLTDDFSEGQETFSFSEQYQLGHFETAHYLETLARALGGTLSTAQIRAEKNRLLKREIPEVVAVLRELSGVVPLACLSNTHQLHWEYILENFPAMQLFSRRFTSFELGVAKPEARCYRLVCDQLGVAPTDCVLIDDRQKNIAGAERLGMRAVHLTNPKQLRTELLALGVPLPL